MGGKNFKISDKYIMFKEESNVDSSFLFYNNTASSFTTISFSCVTHFIVQSFIEQGDTNR